MFTRQKLLYLSVFIYNICTTNKLQNTGDAYKATGTEGGSAHRQHGQLRQPGGQSTTVPKAPKGQSEDSIPDEESDDFRAKDQPSGVMDAQCGKRSSTGFRNLRPWGPHITKGLSRVSPGGVGGERLDGWLPPRPTVLLTLLLTICFKAKEGQFSTVALTKKNVTGATYVT